MSPDTTNSKPQGEEDAGGAYELYLMRHGVAVTRGSGEFADDANRPLTPESKKKMREIAKGLGRLGFAPDWAVSSPLVRAVETVEIIADSLTAKVPTDSCDALRPGGSPEALISFLAKHPNRKRILVVGHEPDLSEMAGRLIGGSRHLHLAFKKGGCCLITLDQLPPKSPGELVWWLTPRILRK